jgi:hypothetical protein
MDNNYDFGIQKDFDNMTYDLGREVLVYPRADVLSHESQQAEADFLKSGRIEVVFLQELDTKHEMVAAGQMKVGDVRFSFMHNTAAEEEGYVSPDGGKTMYKIINLTYVKNQTYNEIMFVKAYGKKVPNR